MIAAVEIDSWPAAELYAALEAVHRSPERDGDDVLLDCPACAKPHALRLAIEPPGLRCSNCSRNSTELAARLRQCLERFPAGVLKSEQAEVRRFLDRASVLESRPSLAPVPTLATLTPLSAYEARAVTYLWADRLPAGMLGLFLGMEGIGKSNISVELAARVSRGQPLPFSFLPDGPRDVILVGTEDACHETLRPRVDAAGGDPERIHLLSEIGGRPPQLPRDIDAIEQIIIRSRAALVVLDPVTSVIGDADSNSNSEVRAALSGLSKVAERTGAAILMINHVRKAGGVAALHRGVGSVAFSALARVVIMALEDPDDPDARILAWPKLSVGPRPPSLRWRLTKRPADLVAHVAWDDEPVNITADDVLERAEAHAREPSAVDRAMEWLRSVLADGPVPSKELQARSEAAGIASKTFQRARERLGLVTKRDGRTRTWTTSLPGKKASKAPTWGSDHLGCLGHLEGGQESQDSQESQKSTIGLADHLGLDLEPEGAA